jgi:hypothetical protein
LPGYGQSRVQGRRPAGPRSCGCNNLLLRHLGILFLSRLQVLRINGDYLPLPHGGAHGGYDNGGGDTAIGYKGQIVECLLNGLYRVSSSRLHSVETNERKRVQESHRTMCRPLWHDTARGSDAAAPNEKWKFPAQQRARLNRILPWLTNAYWLRDIFDPPFCKGIANRARDSTCAWSIATFRAVPS